MGARLGRHLTVNAVAYVALFFALTLGTAWALETNSVKSKHIVDDQVNGDDLAGVDVLESTGDVKINDAADGNNSTDKRLLKTDGFGITATCQQNPAGTIRATVFAVDLADPGDWSFDSTAPNGDDDQTGLDNEALPVLISVGPTTGVHYDTGEWSIRGEGEALHGLVSAATGDDGADCHFGLTMLG